MNVVEANGAKIPAIGLGTMTLKDAVCVEAVKSALRLGYRHIDTAERYGNEAAVGEGLHRGCPPPASSARTSSSPPRCIMTSLRPRISSVRSMTAWRSSSFIWSTCC